MSLSVGVNTHGHCFDGLCSAAVFTELLTQLRPREDLAFNYRSCGYGPKMSAVPADWLKSDLNAILDFRYTESDRLTFYFDHHVTGFASSEEESRARAAALRSKSSGKMQRSIYYDAAYGSCTKLIRDVAERDLGVSLRGLDELVEWADRIDAARFASAEEALADSPAQILAQVVEEHGDAAFLTSMVPELRARPLAQLADQPRIRDLYSPIAKAKAEHQQRVATAAKLEDGVVFVDLSNGPVSPAGKFVTYALFPDAIYSVTVLRTKQLIKVGVGYNPWCGRPRRHDISAICKAEGGGGHPVVGAFTFPLNKPGEAEEAAQRVCRILRN